MKDQAPYCTHRAGTIECCYRRTRHESGRCPQHRPGYNGRGQRIGGAADREIGGQG